MIHKTSVTLHTIFASYSYSLTSLAPYLQVALFIKNIGESLHIHRIICTDPITSRQKLNDNLDTTNSSSVLPVTLI